MSLTDSLLVRGAQQLAPFVTTVGTPARSDICFSPRNAYTNALTPTLYKLGYIRVDAPGAGYSDNAVVSVGGTEVGRLMVGDATVYGAAGAICAVRITNDLGLTLSSAPTLTFSGGSGAVLTAVLADPEQARIGFKADLIEWSYIGCSVDSGGVTDASEAAFITAWQSAYKMALAQNTKPKSAGIPVPPTGYGRPDVTAAVAIGGEVIDASNATYGGGVGYATYASAANVTTKLMLCATTMARTTSKRLMHDDPGAQNQVINVADFGPEAIAGFPTWLAANTSSGERTADALDPAASILPGYDYKAVVVAWYTASGLSGPATSATHNSNRRTIQSGANVGQKTPGYNLWRKYHRSTTRAYYAALKAQLGAGGTLAVNGFAPWPVTPNYAVGGFFFNSAIRDGVMDSADYIATEWTTAAGLDTPITWTLLAATFAIHAHSVRAIGKMITGPQVTLDPYWHNDLKRKSFLRQKVSYIYALGGSCYPCWDSFLQRPNGRTWRAFVEPADYNGLWDFIADNPGLYDGFECCPTVAIPINADTFCRTSSGVFPRNQNLMDAVISLLAAGTPFAFSPYSNLDSTMARNSALEAACSYSLTTTGSNPVITETPTADNWAVAASGGQLSAANAFWVSRIVGRTGAVGDVYAIPRVNLAKQQIAVHICNLQSAANGAGVTEIGLSLEVSDLVRGLGSYTAALYRPGSDAVPLVPVSGSGKDVMALPSIDDRGGVVLINLAAMGDRVGRSGNTNGGRFGQNEPTRPDAARAVRSQQQTATR